MNLKASSRDARELLVDLVCSSDRLHTALHYCQCLCLFLAITHIYVLGPLSDQFPGGPHGAELEQHLGMAWE